MRLAMYSRGLQQGTDWAWPALVCMSGPPLFHTTSDSHPRSVTIFVKVDGQLWWRLRPTFFLERRSTGGTVEGMYTILSSCLLRASQCNSKYPCFLLENPSQGLLWKALAKGRFPQVENDATDLDGAGRGLHG